MGDAGRVDLRSLGPATPGVSLGARSSPSAPRAPLPLRDWASHFHQDGASAVPGGRVGGTCTWACVWGCVWVPAYPNRGEKVRLHFLPFPQEGTHTPLNLTPTAAASRPGVSDRPSWLPPHHTRPWAPAPGRGAGGCAPSLTRLRDACPQGPRHPGRSTAPYPAEGGLAPCRSPGPCSGGGGDILLGLLASSTGAPPAAPGEEGETR